MWLIFTKHSSIITMLHPETIIKGFIVGSTMMVPGVSGGSMAMVLGIYGKLITAVSSFFKDIKNNIIDCNRNLRIQYITSSKMVSFWRVTDVKSKIKNVLLI